MADKSERIEIFLNSMHLCETNEKLIQSVEKSKNGQIIYWDDDELNSDFEKRYENTELLLLPARTCEAARSYKDKKVCILNFASFVTPGGGVTRGTTAQEESICRISTLYKGISDNSVKAFYDSHWKKINIDKIDRRNNDDIIFTPGVTVFKEDDFECSLLPESEWYNVDVITCAAPDLRVYGVTNPYVPTDDELEKLHEKRWKRILTVAARHKADVVILGAFGCGVFGNSPWIVAEAAGRVCSEFDGIFEKIVFAVFTNGYESDNYKAFSSICGIKEH